MSHHLHSAPCSSRRALISWKLIMRRGVYSSAAQRPASLAPASLDHCYHLLLLFAPPPAAAAVTLDQHQPANCYIIWAEHVFLLHFWLPALLCFGSCNLLFYYYLREKMGDG